MSKGPRRRYLLFVDLLGVKAQWHREGRPGAEAAFAQLESLVKGALKAIDPAEIVDGLIESDAAAIVCRSTETAVALGRKIYQTAFNDAVRPQERRSWLRGVITDLPRYERLRVNASVPSPYRRVQTLTYAPGLLEAISVEKSGIQGMRLLIEANLMNRPLLSAFAIDVGNRKLATFKRLQHSSYPERVSKSYEDVLWMLTDEEEWEAAKIAMATRLRLAARDREEFIQAAATQIVFHECASIIWSLKQGQKP